MAYRTALWGWILVHSSFSIFAAAPDLIVWGPATRPYVDYQNIPANSCEVNEGCTVPGTRRILHFETESRNIGTADLVFGDPNQNPMFVWDPCHGHWHFGQFAQYRLLNQSGGVVLEGRKVGFCLEDTIKWDPNAGPQRYNCSFQGIQRGWADRYTYNVPCQFLDITGVPAGTYILDITVDPLNFIAELNEGNNNTQVSVQIPPEDCSVPPPNDAFAAAQTINFVPQVIYGQNNCATKEAWEPNHADVGGRSVWYRWIAPFSRQITITTEGSNFDTMLAAYRFVGGNLTLEAANDDVVLTVVKYSEIRFNTQAGTEYRIAVDGWHGEQGSIVLNMDTPGNDDFAACQTISGAPGSLSGHNIGATREAGEPTHGATFGTHSVWYCWTAPRTATVEWSTIGSDFDTTLAIYRGTAVNQLTPVASDNDSGAGGTSILNFNAVSNTVYRVAIDGRGDAMGNISLRWAYLTARLTVRRNTNGSVTITINGANGTYNLIGSSNLTSWSNAGTITVANGTGSTTLSNPSGRQFFRATMP
jgi:lysyl oxidase